jgi:hypothetical protein
MLSTTRSEATLAVRNMDQVDNINQEKQMVGLGNIISFGFGKAGNSVKV